eukprot:scaffold112489_cov27-Tisochrysis_lutea.AAC.2
MLCPPETSNVRKGNGGCRSCCSAGNEALVSPPVGAGPVALAADRLLGSHVTRACASIWCTRTNGIWCSWHSERAFLTPTPRHKESPGPTVTAIAVKALCSTPARLSASSTVESMAAR